MHFGLDLNSYGSNNLRPFFALPFYYFYMNYLTYTHVPPDNFSTLLILLLLVVNFQVYDKLQSFSGMTSL